jgi:3-mercaptopyruvate sulfurtransferase SseA
LAYQILYKQGHRNMKVLYEGLPGWTKKGYPTEGDS